MSASEFKTTSEFEFDKSMVELIANAKEFQEKSKKRISSAIEGIQKAAESNIGKFPNMEELRSVSRKAMDDLDVELSLLEQNVVSETLQSINSEKLSTSSDISISKVLKRVLEDIDVFKENCKLVVQFYEDIGSKSKTLIEKVCAQEIFSEEIESCKTDVCFMIDGTMSMQPYIDNARDTIIQIIDTTKEVFPKAEIRIAIVVYRDIKDDARFEIFDFTNSVIDAKCFLESLEAEGGADTPEDVNGAFRAIEYLNWKNPVRNLIHIADAGCHGTHMNGLKAEEDDFPEGCPDDEPWEDLMLNLKTLALNYTLLSVHSGPKFMFGKLKEIYEKCRVEAHMPRFFEMEDLTKDKQLLKILVERILEKSIKMSFSHTFEKFGIESSTRQLLIENEQIIMKSPSSLQLERRVVSSKPDWDSSSFFSQEIETKILYAYSSANEMSNVLNFKSMDQTTETVRLRVRKTPFAEGTFSLAYYCQVKPENSKIFYNMVLKRHKNYGSYKYTQGTLHKNNVGIFFANKYNEALKKCGFDKNYQIHFTRVLAVKIGSEYYILEGYIPGTFVKYTNNFTYVNEKVPFMTAFSHFSYHISDGKFMVTDLQGSNTLLTDSVASSLEGKFLPQGDTGTKGMMAFFRQHECNDFCRKLGLPEHNYQKDKVRPVLRKDVLFSISYFYKKCKYYLCNGNAKESELCEICKENLPLPKGW